MRSLKTTVFLTMLFGNIFAFDDICCQSNTSLKICLKIFGIIEWTFGPEINCPEDYYCDDSVEEISPCIPGISTTTVQTTTSCPPGVNGSEPNCSAEGLHPGPYCNQYYQCSKFLLLWYEVKLLECESGEAFSSTELACKPRSGACECLD